MGYHVRGAEKRFKSTGICPPAIEMRVGQTFLADVRVVDVGDFEFASFGRYERADFFKDAAIIHIDTGDGEIGLGGAGLFFNTDDLVAIEFGDAETLGIVDLFEENLGSYFLPAESIGCFADISFYDVVAQDDADLLAIGEMFAETERVGDAAFAFLVGVVDMLQAEEFSVGEEAQEVAGVFASRDDHDIFDPGVDKRLDRVIDHGLIVDGKKMLVGDFCEGKKATARSACEDDTFHNLKHRIPNKNDALLAEWRIYTTTYERLVTRQVFRVWVAERVSD